MTDRMDINRVLAEMRAIKEQAQSMNTVGANVKDQLQPQQVINIDKTSDNFGELFERAVNTVNDIQKTSSTMAQAYEKGDPNVALTDVMIASEKASVSFQSMLQVRNKLVDAYRDIMNMPV